MPKKKGRPITFMTPGEAVDYAAQEYNIFISEPTVIKWAPQFKFGHQLGGKGGPWQINKSKFKNYLIGKK